MRTVIAIALALGLLGAVALAQELVTAEPGVFVYSYDDNSERYERTYYPTQAEANEALRASWDAARASAEGLKAQIGNTSINSESTAQWLVFAEQWHMWQEWVIQEYELGDVFGEWEGTGGARFAAVPGTTLRWEVVEEPVPGAIARGVAAGFQRARDAEGGGASAFGGEEFALQGGGLAGAQAEPEVPTAAVTLANFTIQTAEGQQIVIDQLHDIINQMVSDKAEEHYLILVAILDEVDDAQEARTRRAAYVATRQREITNLREIILNRQSATEVEIDGTLYLFSEQPLSRIPEEAINISTPNLTPYDIFHEDGTIRTAAP